MDSLLGNLLRGGCSRLFVGSGHLLTLTGPTILPKVGGKCPDAVGVKSLSTIGFHACLAAALLLSGCSRSEPNAIDQTGVTNLAFADETEAMATTTTTLIDGAPTAPLPQGSIGYVEFEATWICELQRRTFPTPDAIDAALDEKLVQSGLDRVGYDSFRAEVNGDQDLRDAILYTYQETCRP
jgi:hypothetical protein